jgi:hypothetical protein
LKNMKRREVRSRPFKRSAFVESPGWFPGFFYLGASVRFKFIFTLAVCFFAHSALWAWGAVGHRTIAYIAQDRLTPEARREVRRILGPDENLVYVSTWADTIAHTRPETAPWHYIQVNVREDQNSYDLSDVCRDHQCVVDQIERDEEVLRNQWASRSDRKEALKFLVHFVGDVHQPLHCAEDNDRGGNEKWFRYYGSRKSSRRYTWVNLHSFWDNLLEPHAKENPRKLATQLEQNLTEDQVNAWQGGSPRDWAYESFRIARDNIYSELPSGPLLEKNRWGRDLPDDYYTDQMKAIVNERLLKAGLRLAYVLNQIFRDP